MKKSLTGILALLAGAYAADSQGTVSMYDYGATIVTLKQGLFVGLPTPLGGSDTGSGAGNGNLWTVQLWGSLGANLPPSALAALGGASTATFANGITDVIPGTWYSTGIATIGPGQLGGKVATVQLYVWFNGGGLFTSYAAAVAGGVPAGYAQKVNVTLGGGLYATPDITSVIGSFSIPPPAPAVVINANPTNGPAPLTVQFGSSGIDSAINNISSWNWMFGDGATSTNQNPAHTYTNTGIFYPTLLAVNSLGDTVVGSCPALIMDISVSPLSIVSVSISGPNLVLNGTNGVFGGTYYVLTSTNLKLPLSQWTPVATNISSTSGDFTITVTNALNLNVPNRFYILETK